MTFTAGSAEGSVVQKPLSAVQDLFQRRFGAAPDVSAGGADFGEQAFFQQIIADPNLASQIPAIGVNDINHVPNGSLVRFRGMVQDMFNPEVFVGAFREPSGSWHTCKYTDVVPQGVSEAAETTVWERRPFFCVPVPSEAAWYREEVLPAARMNNQGATTAEPRDKRLRDDNDTDVASFVSSAVTDMDVVESGEEAASSHPKQQKQQQGAGASGTPSGAAAMALPAASGGNSLPCLVHVYDKDASILLNDVVEVVGVLSCAPELAQFGFGAEDMEEDLVAAHPPASKVPRIHAILVRSTSSKGPGRVPSAAVPAGGPLQPAEMLQGRDQALRVLSAVTGNDRLAAEYLLLNLLSRVVSRGNGVLVGSHNLNITGWPEDGAASSVLFRLLQELTPRAAMLDISVEAMNEDSLVPKKNYSTDRLDGGALQLAQGTHCLLDESTLKEGKFLEPGVQNLQALQSVLTNQELEYDFQYYKLPIKTDIPAVIVSQGRSLLRESVDAQVPLNATTAVGDAESLAAAFAVSDVPLARRYIATAKQMEFEIPQEMNTVIEAAIVSHKKGSTGPPDTGTFHRWITMARLVAGSQGEAKLSSSTWAAVMQMEHARQERIRVA